MKINILEKLLWIIYLKLSDFFNKDKNIDKKIKKLKKQNKRISDIPFSTPFDVSFNEQREYYINNGERHTQIKNTDRWWFSKLFTSKIELELTLGELFYIKRLLNNSEYNIDFLEYSNNIDEYEGVSEDFAKNWLIDKIQCYIEESTNNSKEIENIWKDFGGVPDCSFNEEEEMSFYDYKEESEE